MRLGNVGRACLLFVPLARALPNLNPEPRWGLDWERDDLDLPLRARGLLDPPGESSTTSTAATTTTHQTSTTPDPETSTTPTSTTAATTSSTSTTAPTSTTTQTTTSHSATRFVSTNDDGDVFTTTVFPTVSATTSSASSAPTDDDSDSGPGKGTFIGLGVAGGIAVLGLCGFLVWKFTQKRFSQFDDDGGDIKWPAPKEELIAPTAPAMSASANATSSSVDLTADPYAVPPLPVRSGPYYDDPSGTAGAAYYDPYRGPVPLSFQSPPQSTDGHVQMYSAGEAIPMSTYSTSTGRQSPGPNVAYDDPYARSRSPGPNMAYDDPYAGRRSPGPAVAYGMDPARSGTPVSMAPPRMGTPLGAQAYGRTSPAPPNPYMAAQQPLVNPYGRSTPNPYGP